MQDRYNDRDKGRTGAMTETERIPPALSKINRENDGKYLI